MSKSADYIKLYTSERGQNSPKGALNIESNIIESNIRGKIHQFVTF